MLVDYIIGEEKYRERYKTFNGVDCNRGSLPALMKRDLGID
jgi:hypothetical protein